MTFCKSLAEKTLDNGDNVTAWELYEKNAKVPHYEIVIARDGIALSVLPCARTTWKRKFNELI